MALPIYTSIPNLKGLTKTCFKLSRLKGNLCGDGGGGMTMLNPKYLQLSSWDTITKFTFDYFLVLPAEALVDLKQGSESHTECDLSETSLYRPQHPLHFVSVPETESLT